MSISSYLLVAALFVLATSIGISCFAFRVYRGEKIVADLRYTRLVRLRDVASCGRKAIAALQDAEIEEQNYVLTGETIYSEAYADNVGEWQDEVSVLGIQSAGGPLDPLVQDLTKAGDRTVRELALIVSAYDAGSRDKALESIRKGSGIVYLERTRDIAGKIMDANDDEVEAAERDTTFGVAGSSLRRLAKSVAALFGLTFLGALLLMVAARREYQANARTSAGTVR